MSRVEGWGSKLRGQVAYIMKAQGDEDQKTSWQIVILYLYYNGSFARNF